MMTSARPRVSGPLVPRTAGPTLPGRGRPLSTPVAVAVFVAVVACACSFAPAGAECVNHGDYLHWVDGLLGVSDVAVSGGHAYVLRQGMLEVIDISDPGNPQTVGSVSMPAGRVAVSGTHAYVAVNSGYYCLRVIDVANPTNPQVVGEICLGYNQGSVHDLSVSGTRACVTYMNEGFLRVFDISDPANPQSVGVMNTPGGASGVVLSGGIAYVADGNAGLVVINITSLQVLGGANTPGAASDVAVSGTHAYVADGSGLEVIDVTNPASPRL